MDVISRVKSRARLCALLIPALIVFIVYVVIPSAVAWIGAFVLGFIAAIRRGPSVLDTADFQKYIGNLEGFFGELCLLVASGILTVSLWRRRQLEISRSRLWIDVAIGITVGVFSEVCSKLFVVPWLYLARPLGSEWIKPEYISVSSYGRTYINQIASVFFVDTVYTALVETTIIVGFFYAGMRAQWNVAVSALYVAIIFAAMHRNGLLFLDFFLFALINFALYEWRKSLVAPFFHHLTFNALIYGSQLALFSGLPTK
jgi:membrane protease YdiL (CAAX protease family)